MNNQIGTVDISVQTENGEVSLMELVCRKLKEQVAAQTREKLGDTPVAAELIKAQGELIDQLIDTDVRQALAMQSVHHFGRSTAAIKEAMAIAKSFKDITDQHGIFNAAVALTDRAAELGVVMKLSMPTAKEEDRFGTRSFLTVSKFHNETGDTVLMHPTPNATGCVHG